MNRTTLLAAVLLPLAFIVAAPVVYAQQQASSNEAAAPPLEQLLRPDGSIDLNRPYRGSYDVSGWRMILAEDGSPRFVRSDEELEAARGRAALLSDPADDAWDTRFGPPGTGGTVYALAVHGTDLYIGGDFSLAGTALAFNVVCWSTTRRAWEVLGDEYVNGVGGPVYAMAVYGNNLYVGGIFESAGNVRASGIAKWDIARKRWSSLGGGVAAVINTWIWPGYVRAIAADSASVFVGGLFLMADADTVYNLARWDIASQSWSAACKTDANRIGGEVYALALDGSNLYVGGGFGAVADIDAQGIAKWDLATNTWSALDSGLYGNVRAIVAANGRLIAGGDFTRSGSRAVGRVAEWNGSRWQSVGTGVDDTVYSMYLDGRDLYVGGTFGSARLVAANNIARWNGAAWSQLRQGVTDTASPWVRAIVAIGGSLFAGGRFTTAGLVPATNVAMWDTTWKALGRDAGPVRNGTDGSVRALAIDGDIVYVGGDFSYAGGVAASRIAAWSRSTGLWTALGAGIEGEGSFVRALALAPNGDLYVGGIFTRAGGVATRGIARWSGSRWLPLAQGVDGVAPYVFALAIDGTDLYAGGSFSGAGGVGSAKIARWGLADSSWHALAQGITGDSTYTFVTAVAAGGGAVYAAGEFSRIGSLRVNRIARWNGSTWSALGTGDSVGLNAPALALVLSGSKLIAGGEFTRAGTVEAKYLASWDGAAWSAPSSSPNAKVNALRLDGGRLLVGGAFTMVGAQKAGHAAVLDLAAGTWETLDPVNGPIYAMASVEDEIYGGGEFSTAGDARAANVAQWHAGGWSSMGNDPAIGVAGPIYALARQGTDIFVGGNFRTTGGMRVNGIARWNGDRWVTVGTGVRGGGQIVRAIAVAGNGDVFAGGTFAVAGSDSAANIARWDGRRWFPLGRGITSTAGRPIVYALTIDGDNLYVGGIFNTAGGLPANNIARWEIPTGSWQIMGTGIRSVPSPSRAPIVYALASTAGTVVATGRFDTAGADPVRNIARWDGTRWSAMGAGIEDTGRAVTVYNGEFAVASGHRVIVARGVYSWHRIHRWRAGTWEPLDTGSGIIYSLVYDSKGRLYAGGWLASIGNSETGGKLRAEGVVRFDGTRWMNFGSGIIGVDYLRQLTLGFVYAILPNMTELYVGGDFILAGHKPSLYFARWEGDAGRVADAVLPVAMIGSPEISRIDCAPNPVEETARLSLTVADGATTTLNLYDTRGDRVRTLLSGPLRAGEHSVSLDASDLPAGAYVLRLDQGGTVVSKWIVVQR